MDYNSKVRESDENFDIRIKEAVRRNKIECEEELREKLKSSERRHLEAIEEIKLEITTYKRKLEDSLRENDSLRRKILLSKQDGKQESQIEIDVLNNNIKEIEDQLRTQSSDNRKLREELSIVNNKLVSYQAKLN